MKTPFRRKNPYITRGVVPEKFNGQDAAGLGFLSTIKGDYDKLRKDVKSVWDRLNYRYSQGEPAAYIGGKIFEPQADVISFDLQGDGTLDDINIVAPSGQTFRIPVVLEAPGVFVARSMTVALHQRYHDPAVGEQWVPLPYGKSFFNVNSAGIRGGEVQTLKHSIMRELPDLPAIANTSSTDRLYGTNFLWNLEDTDSGRMLSDDLIPDQALFPQGWQGQADGDIYHFATPWLFERENTLTFHIQFLNDVLQLDAGSALHPVSGVDDLEDGLRKQDVRVRIELHGTKHYNDRDALLREAS